ncbi:MAG: hypothetical protein AAGN35_25965 [Bacteroidota bacterium]
MKALAILNIAAYVGTLVINALANALPINGMTTGDLSALYPNKFVPAGFTFSIWGIIYLWLGVFVVYQAVVAFSAAPPPGNFVSRVGPWFLISSLFNVSWIVAWHYQQVPLSLLIMLGILISLIMIYQRLPVGLATASGTEKFLVFAPFSIYLGWITVATIANVTTLLVDIGWGGLGISDVSWTVTVMVVAILIGLTMAFQRSDIFFPLVGVWALFGIYAKRSAVDPEPLTAILYTAIGGMTILGLGILVQVIRGKVYAG